MWTSQCLWKFGEACTPWNMCLGCRGKSVTKSGWYGASSCDHHTFLNGVMEIEEVSEKTYVELEEHLFSETSVVCCMLDVDHFL